MVLVLFMYIKKFQSDIIFINTLSPDMNFFPYCIQVAGLQRLKMDPDAAPVAMPTRPQNYLERYHFSASSLDTVKLF